MKPHTLFTPTALLALSCAVAAAQPTDNPAKTQYGDGNYPVWTDTINWANVIDVTSGPGGNDGKAIPGQRHNNVEVLSWLDAANNELGFRVEKKVGEGDGRIIALRPRASLNGVAAYPTLALASASGQDGAPAGVTANQGVSNVESFTAP